MMVGARQPITSKPVDDLMPAIKRGTPSLQGTGVLTNDCAGPLPDKQRMGRLTDLVERIGLGDEVNRSRDILGRVIVHRETLP
jgi:type I restriction enzyme M protein